jgi:hypothetical protein
LVRHLKGQVTTNLSEAEILSLLAAGLAQPDSVQFSSIPLAPLTSPSLNDSSLTSSKQPPGGLGAKAAPTRHIASDAPSPLWPSP